MERPLLDQLMTKVEERIRPHGYLCLEIRWVFEKDSILRIFIDKEIHEDSTVDVNDCAKVSSLLAEWTELDDLIEGSYQLEISSPGVERPLRKVEHFQQELGSGNAIKIKLNELSENRRNGTGTVKDVNPLENMVTMETDLGPWSFSLDKLKCASLVYDWKNQ